MDHFRRALESISVQTFRDFEVVIVDNTQGDGVLNIAREIFPHDGRLNYYRLKASKGMPYALNVGLHRRDGTHVMFMGQHDCLSEKALSFYKDEIEAHPGVDIVYSDWDEIVGRQRQNPAFLPDFNVELLRHMNYIGDFAVFSVDALRRIGTVREQLDTAAIYDLLLRGVEKKVTSRDIPRLLYHKRIFGDMVLSPEYRKGSEKTYREHVTVAAAHLHRCGIGGDVTPDKSGEFWKVHYDGSKAKFRTKEYILIKGKGVEVRTSHYLERMYGILKQKDVGLVGARFERGFQIDNCGYIFDEKGLVYPVCCEMSAFEKGYMNRAVIPWDVSMVDSSLFLLDAQILEKVGGIDKRLTGHAMMLDLCFKIKEAGRRVVIDPVVVARKWRDDDEDMIDETSRKTLCEVWQDVIKKGDPYYNSNLPMGLRNYTLY